MAPAMVSEPEDIDAGGTNLSGDRLPARFAVEPGALDGGTARLTPQALARRLRAHLRLAAPQSGLAAQVTVYTPAQIRAAYGLAPLPPTGTTPSAAQSAAFGAGQTVYVVDANDSPTIAADLAAFSAKFGLPACSALSVTSVPLPVAGAGCSFAKVSTNADSQLLRAMPGYDAGWAAEISLDVEWVHAIAPLARIVLIEVPSGQSDDLVGGVSLANQMGAGVVSMSFGASEGRWMSAVDSTFAQAGMSYVAAAGDDGAGVNWPSASPGVLAVGATTLTWSGVGARHEVAWNGTGGGASAVEPLPSWQTGLSIASGPLVRRTVADVAFNGDPMTGQYVAVTDPGTTTTHWNAYGGTSLATPQWAGILAVANAQRAAAGVSPLGDPHALLYRAIGAVPGHYAAAFNDIVSGLDGLCGGCRAAVGYDAPTGWGTPSVAGLLPLLAGTGGTSAVVAAPVAPIVPGGSLNARAGVLFSQSLGITVPAGANTTYRINGGPAGLGVNGTGQIQWLAPAVGSYTFIVTATTSMGATASGRYTLVVAPAAAPTLAGGSFSASAGASFSAVLQGSEAGGAALSYSIAGAPAGLVLSSSGVLSWSQPVAGTYAFRVTALDPHGLGATAVFTLTVAKSSASSVVGSLAVSGTTGQALVFRTPVAPVPGMVLTFSLVGAPAGMMVSGQGVASWATPVVGRYVVGLRVGVAGSSTLLGTGTLTITISAQP